MMFKCMRFVIVHGLAELVALMSKRLVKIPAKIHPKYRLEVGSKVLFVESRS